MLTWLLKICHPTDVSHQLTSFRNWGGNLCCSHSVEKLRRAITTKMSLKKSWKMLSAFSNLLQMFDLQSLPLNASDIRVEKKIQKIPLEGLTVDEKIFWRHFHSKYSFNSPPRDTAADTTSKLNYPECVAVFRNVFRELHMRLDGNTSWHVGQSIRKTFFWKLSNFLIWTNYRERWRKKKNGSGGGRSGLGSRGNYDRSLSH